MEYFESIVIELEKVSKIVLLLKIIFILSLSVSALTVIQLSLPVLFYLCLTIFIVAVGFKNFFKKSVKLYHVVPS